ncbi:hypothetical protein J4233_03690 [Candidatus Pacearchaeota archaeon]|nr:hypothetical protein [Candidatus Pacearchaeota archaeon]
MAKPVRVVFIDDKLEREYLNLSKGAPLRKRIDYVIGRIKENPTFGQPIPKRLIPKEYTKKGTNNAYWVELSKGMGWRLIYTLTAEEKVEIVAIILEWFTRHKDYERRFRY